MRKITMLRIENHESISTEGIERASRLVDPVFLNSPQFKSESLSDLLGMEVVLKVETVNPIRSFKGRGADFFVSQLPSESSGLVCATAGNFGQGLAYAARKRRLQLVVFAAETANPLKVDRMRQLGAEVRLVGKDFDAAKDQARNFAAQNGMRFVEDGREPKISEGAGTIAVEVCRWHDSFNFVLIPLGDGALISGIGYWMKAKSPATRVVGVCASGAPAMALSWQQREPITTETASTIADGIATRVPVPEAVVNICEVVDEILLIDDKALLEAMRLLFDFHGLVTEPAGVAGLAAAITYREQFRNARVVIPLTGGNLTNEQVKQWLI